MDTLRSLTRMVAQAALLGEGPLAGLLGGQGGGGIFGAIGSAIFGGMGGPSLGAMTTATLFHGGGVAGGPGSGSRRVPTSLYSIAPRFHAGLTNDEIPAILQRGEQILTAAMADRTSSTMAGLAALAASSGGGGGRVEVNIFNEAGVDIEQRPNESGGVDVILRQLSGAIAKDIGSGGPVGRAISGSFNVKRRTGR